MGFGSDIIKYWVQNFYGPKLIKYEPGFIVTEFDNKYGKAFQRLVVLPEQICIQIESIISKEYGQEGIKLLEKIGKMWGYNFAFTVGAPKLSSHGEKFVKDYISYSVSYAMSSWSKESNIIKFDLINNEYIISYDGHIICNKNGCGVLFTESIISGFLEYILEKPLCVKKSTCQGRGDELCIIEYTKLDTTEVRLLYTDFGKYKLYNQIRKTHYSKLSLSNLFDNKTVRVEQGIFFIKNQLIFASSSLLLYLFDYEILRLPKGKDILFNICFNWAKQFSVGQNHSFIVDTLSAFGFGDLIIKEENNNFTLILNNYPWEPIETSIEDFCFIRSICSGMLSAVYNREIILKHSTKIFENNSNSFSVILS